MAFDRFLIAPYGNGLQRNIRPWLVADDSFVTMENVYLFRGRIRKRFGSYLMGVGATSPLTAPLLSRLRINLGTTDPTTGNFIANPVTPVGTVWSIGQLFSVGDQIFTVYQASGAMLATAGTGMGTFDTTTGELIITTAALDTIVYFYPGLPVMGLTLYETGQINNYPSYAFDPQYAYTYDGTSWQRSGSGTSPQWHGDDTNFFWATNWYGNTADDVTLFVTNFHAAFPTPDSATDDPIWYTMDGSTWNTFNPVFLSTGAFVQTARLIITFKNRLLLLGTIENDNAMSPTARYFKNRCRFSIVGGPFANNSWLEPNQSFMGSNAGGAGFIDATTEESIISAEFIKDRLIVYFDRSTWELAYTGNEILPFVWQKINTELGSEATFSSVPFDKVILTIGNTGVHACNGANVERIDNLIPDEVFEIRNSEEGLTRVAGIRDYFTEMVYWTFPLDNDVSNFPNKILVYNYKTGAWSFNDDSITSWGYFEQQIDTTWSSTFLTWETINSTWISGVQQSKFRQIIAGNQEGFVFIIDPDLGRNAGVLQVTNLDVSTSMLTVYNHNLAVGQYVALENAQGISTPIRGIYPVAAVIDENTIIIGNSDLIGTYIGGGTLARVSNINMLTKEFNPYVDKGRDVYIYKIDCAVQKTDAGAVTVDAYPSSTKVSLLDDGINNQCILGTGILSTAPYLTIPLEAEQSRLWHPVYLQAEGNSVQLRIFMSSDQITNPAIAYSDFELEGMILHTKPTTSRIQ